jgi:hypothetical protein
MRPPVTMMRFLPGAGHINVASGYGPWPFAFEWLASVDGGDGRRSSMGTLSSRVRPGACTCER